MLNTLKFSSLSVDFDISCSDLYKMIHYYSPRNLINSLTRLSFDKGFKTDVGFSVNAGDVAGDSLRALLRENYIPQKQEIEEKSAVAAAEISILLAGRLNLTFVVT